jgi:hypothetical protein
MLGHGRKAHRERLRQLLHRRFPEGEAGKDRAPRGVREGLEGGVESVSHGQTRI